MLGSFTREVTEIEVKNTSFKCDQYKFSSEKEITFHKHKNTKHKNNKQWKHKCDECECVRNILIKALFHFDDVSNLYQQKIVEGETLYVCNLCYDGFEIFEDVKKHIVNYQ